MEPKQKKVPYLILFWADTRELLTFEERNEVEGQDVRVTGCTPREVLLTLADGRRVVVRGVLDPDSPLPPRPRH